MEKPEIKTHIKKSIYRFFEKDLVEYTTDETRNLLKK